MLIIFAVSSETFRLFVGRFLLRHHQIFHQKLSTLSTFSSMEMCFFISITTTFIHPIFFIITYTYWKIIFFLFHILHKHEKTPFLYEAERALRTLNTAGLYILSILRATPSQPPLLHQQKISKTNYRIKMFKNREILGSAKFYNS